MWSDVRSVQCDQIVAIYCILGNFSKPVATIDLPKLPTCLGIFCKVIKIVHFASEIILGELLFIVWQFFTGHTGYV